MNLNIKILIFCITIIVVVIVVGFILAKPKEKIMENISSSFMNFSTEYINLSRNQVRLSEEISFPEDPKLKIKLLDVTSDGRCPSDVECGHSGWATVLVEASYGDTVEKKELHIRGGTSYVFLPPEESNNKLGSGNIISVGEYKIFLAALSPYPVTTRKIEKEKYEGTFFADTVTNLDFKKEIVQVATSELEKNLPDYTKYKAIHINKDNDLSYTISFDIPFDSKDGSVWVKIKHIDNTWKAIDFSLDRA